MGNSISQNNQLVDLQVNGLTVKEGGAIKVVDFSQAALSEEDVRAVCRSLRDEGVCLFLPTIITASQSTYLQNVKVISTVMDEKDLGGMIGGIHLEGPYLSRECKGIIGAHPEKYIRSADINEFKRIFEAAEGKISLMTIAPDAENAIPFIKQATELGVVISIGHHAASTDQILDAVDAGATGITHAGNAWSRNNYTRKSSDVFAQLLDERLYVMIIPDGRHLTSDFVYHAWKAVKQRDPGKFIIVSDGSPLANAPLGHYTVFTNLEADVIEDPITHDTYTEPLTGSWDTLNRCLDKMKSAEFRGHLIMNPDEALAAATINPLEFISAPLKRLDR
jgi:N-acetylglucosamine-6-phosphate deacetylase